MIKSWFKNIGPGPLVAAAFIGPGTVTLCTMAGVNFGYALLWAMGLSVVATIILQEMSARLGIIAQKGLADVIRSEINNPVLKYVSIVLILSAIVIGNAAYEAGNISGGVGASGIGVYHGKHGFDTFSHHKSVSKRGTWIDPPIRYAPYNNKLSLLKRMFKLLG